MIIISLRLLSFLCFLVILIPHAMPHSGYQYYRCNDRGNYTTNSTYQTNLKTLLSNLTSNTEIDYGFYNFSYGQNLDEASAIGLCRGDVKADSCHSCLKNLTVLLPEVCPNQKEAIGGYNECILHYSNSSVLGVQESDFHLCYINPNVAREIDKFNQVLRDLLDKLRSKAAAGDTRLKYAADDAAGPSFQTIFALVQCIPHLSEQECNDCLVKAISETANCVSGKIGGRVIRPSCNFRFEISPFFEATPNAPPPASVSPPPSTTTNTTTSEGKSNTTRTIIAIVVPIVVFVVLLIIIYIYLRVRKLRRY